MWLIERQTWEDLLCWSPVTSPCRQQKFGLTDSHDKLIPLFFRFPHGVENYLHIEKPVELLRALWNFRKIGWTDP